MTPSIGPEPTGQVSPDPSSQPVAGENGRLELLEESEARRVAKESGVPSMMAKLSIFQLLLRQPKLAKGVNDLLMSLLAAEHLAHRQRELVIMRIGWRTGSVYEWAQHWEIARAFGVSDEDLLALRCEGPPAGFDEKDVATIRAVDDVLETGSLSEETWQACRSAFQEDELVLLELVSSIAAWHMISIMLKSLQVPLEPGVMPWPPDGRSPEDPPLASP
jgi:alkylhydroperoxidase family enzyme